ncbi:MAG: hypothetical protein II192_05550, partial [Clostridia bacterium]|nr:hypothetical protein [Clostridia bacterium]
MTERAIFYTHDRREWRAWLSSHFETESEIWFVFPGKSAGEESLSYNDAVEEALCFGWIDSTVKPVDGVTLQRFSPRQKNALWT